MKQTNEGMYNSNENGLGVVNISAQYDIDNFIKEDTSLVKQEQAGRIGEEANIDLLLAANISSQMESSQMETNQIRDIPMGVTDLPVKDEHNLVENMQNELNVQGIEIAAENFPKKEENSNPITSYDKNGDQNISMPNSDNKINHWNIFHNPFDINSYPITNPPIFDSTMMLPYNSQDMTFRRRRISISNGQIGQIVNHEAFFENDLTTPEFTSPNPPSDNLNDTPSHQNNLNHQTFPVENSNIHSGNNPPQSIGNLAMSASMPDINQQLAGHVKQLLVSDKPILTSIAAPHEAPKYQIIYKNEVISTHNGPMPGTAAWKKERLLERNRIAASKCRQRKKQIQRQLQTSITEYQAKDKLMSVKLNKYEKLFHFYNLKLKEHFNGDSDSLNDLKKFLDVENIDCINEEDIA